MIHSERHRTSRTGWLRAAVLGANDGIVSTASLILGVAASGASAQNIIVAGSAGLVAGQIPKQQTLPGKKKNWMQIR
jgi:VIT1/CCC1 family predicted Fe2+/Mn2+ transporter